jgi:peptidyl-prolyl cis-trans isomerase A (cyclophilin A)
VRFYAIADSEPGSVKLYRFYNTQTGAHFYTTQDDERDAVDQHLPQFVDEGVVYNVYPAASQQ